MVLRRQYSISEVKKDGLSYVLRKVVRTGICFISLVFLTNQKRLLEGVGRYLTLGTLV